MIQSQTTTNIMIQSQTTTNTTFFHQINYITSPFIDSTHDSITLYRFTTVTSWTLPSNCWVNWHTHTLLILLLIVVFITSVMMMMMMIVNQAICIVLWSSWLGRWKRTKGMRSKRTGARMEYIIIIIIIIITIIIMKRMMMIGW